LYKKQQKERQRQTDRERKKQQKEKLNAPSLHPIENDCQDLEIDSIRSTKLPWALLLISWIGFVAFVALT
jgi:hypothetical protein